MHQETRELWSKINTFFMANSVYHRITSHSF